MAEKQPPGGGLFSGQSAGQRRIPHSAASQCAKDTLGMLVMTNTINIPPGAESRV